MYHAIVVGSGYAGAISARLLAEQGQSVLLIERRAHIAGNMYDEKDEHGVLVHRYGPHISVMNNRLTYDFLSRFTEWIPYHHHVNAEIDGKEVPLPFNLNSLSLLFPLDEAEAIETKLVASYGYGADVPVLELRQNPDPQVHKLADYVYDRVFLHYTMKMWALTPEKISPAVTGRVPVRISHDDRHFRHKIQVMPKHGFTALFRQMLDHPNITLQLNTNAAEHLTLNEDTHHLLWNGTPYGGKVIYTGALDELLGYRYGILPYRSLEFHFESYPMDYIQTTPVLNWPDDRPYMRRTEMKRLTQQKIPGVTTVVCDEPGPYTKGAKKWNEPCYPINEPGCLALYKQYAGAVAQYPQIYPVGRLADYKYYNMEDTILRTLALFEEELAQ